MPITTSGWVKSMTTSVLPSVSRLSGSPASSSADRVRSSAAATARTIVAPTLPLAPRTPTRMAFTLDRAVLEANDRGCTKPGVRREALVDRVEVKDLHGSSVAAV